MGLHPSWRKFQHVLRRRLTRVPASRRRHRDNPMPLSAIARRVLNDLQRDGVASVSFHQLIGEGAVSIWSSMSSFAQEFAASPPVQQAARRLDLAHSVNARDKNYIIGRIRDGEEIPSDHALLRFALHGNVLGVANAYLGLWAKLHHCNLWHTIPCDAQRPRTASQRWHRDPEDTKLIKVFVYFTDVDQHSGPLEYISGSRAGGPYASLWRFAGGAGVGGYPPQQMIEETVPVSERFSAIGPRGTVVFCDTSGLHRGGFSTEQERLIGNWTYLTPASLHTRRFRPVYLDGHTMTAAQKYAVG